MKKTNYSKLYSSQIKNQNMISIKIPKVPFTFLFIALSTLIHPVLASDSPQKVHEAYKKSMENCQITPDISNHINAFTEMGIRAYNKADYAMAKDFLEKSTNPTALFYLAKLHQDGKGIPSNPEQAKRFYHEAANNGHTEAQLYLAQLYDKGMKESEAKLYYWLAANSGNLFAQIKTSEYSKRERDFQNYILYRKLAANQGDPESCYIIAKEYFHGTYTKVISYSEAYNFFIKASEASENPEADYYIAVMLDNGMGVSEDKFMAFDIYKTLADTGHVEAMCKVGEFYASGFIDGINIDAAIDYYSRAAEKKHPRANYCLGFIHEFSRGEYSKAHGFYMKALKDTPENPEIWKALAGLYESGKGTKQSCQTAKTCHQQVVRLLVNQPNKTKTEEIIFNASLLQLNSTLSQNIALSRENSIEPLLERNKLISQPLLQEEPIDTPISPIKQKSKSKNSPSSLKKEKKAPLQQHKIKKKKTPKILQIETPVPEKITNEPAEEMGLPITLISPGIVAVPGEPLILSNNTKNTIIPLKQVITEAQKISIRKSEKRTSPSADKPLKKKSPPKKVLSISKEDTKVSPKKSYRDTLLGHQEKESPLLDLKSDEIENIAPLQDAQTSDAPTKSSPIFGPIIPQRKNILEMWANYGIACAQNWSTYQEWLNLWSQGIPFEYDGTYYYPNTQQQYSIGTTPYTDNFVDSGAKKAVHIKRKRSKTV